MAEEKHRKQRKEMSKLNVMSYEILLIQIYEKKICPSYTQKTISPGIQNSGQFSYKEDFILPVFVW